MTGHRHALVLMIALSACGPGEREGGDPNATVDARTSSSDSQQAQCYAGTTEVEVDLQIQIEQSCAIWNSLAKLDGRATVSRTGTSLTIDFGESVVFSGTISGTQVMLKYAHQHPFSDGCGWQATETLAGQIDLTSCKLSLTYNYVEMVVQNNGGCASPCNANANVTLELTPIIL